MDKTLKRILSLLPKDESGGIKHGAKAYFARSLGFSDGAIVSMWEKGSSRSYTGYLYEIAKMYGVSIAWLKGDTDDPRPVEQKTAADEFTKKYRALDEHGKKLVDLILQAEYERCNQVETVEIVDLGTIRHYLSKPAAGPGGMVEGEDYEEIPRTADTPAGADFCISIRGDSMEPFIPDGSLVYVQRGAPLKEFEPGVFFVDGDVFCKQWCTDYAGTLHLLSANPLRQDANIDIPRDSGRVCICFGKVLMSRKLPPPIYN